jgi:hypothetical protein
MQKLVLIISLALLAPIGQVSAAGTRDETIKRIESIQLSTAVFAPESPFLLDMLKPALMANPDVKADEWDSIRREASAAISSVMSQPGGMMDVTYRAALSPLSDAELDRLAVLLGDPVLRKFSASMTAPATQQQVIKALMTNTEQMGTALNLVLAKHRLKTTH